MVFSKAGRPRHALLKQLVGVRFAVTLRPVADRGIEGAPIADALRPGNGVIAHANDLLPRHRTASRKHAKPKQFVKGKWRFPYRK
jgi:hypothetical protein